MKKFALFAAALLAGASLSACWDHGHAHGPGDRPSHHHGHDHHDDGNGRY